MKSSGTVDKEALMIKQPTGCYRQAHTCAALTKGDLGTSGWKQHQHQINNRSHQKPHSSPSSHVHVTKAQRLACARAVTVAHLAFGQWSGLCPVGRFLDAHLHKVSQACDASWCKRSRSESSPARSSSLGRLHARKRLEVPRNQPSQYFSDLDKSTRHL